MLAATVREAARRFGALPALVDPDGSVTTYALLDRRSDAVAAALAARGVGAGDRVVLRLPSDSGYVVAYAAAAKLGAVTAGVNPRLARPEQDALVALAEPAVVLADAAEVAALAADGRALVDRGGPPPALPADPDRPVAIVFTSGTTGLPKGAVFCERQLEAVAVADTGGGWAAGAGAAMLASTQFAHVGFTTKLPWYLRMATRTHILGRWRADDALRTIAEQRMPSIGGVAPQLALMVRSPEAARHDWDHVTTVVVGGAASPPALVAAVRARFGAAYSIRYSSTESGGCGTGTAFDADDDEALHSVGRPRAGVEVTVRTPDGGAEVPPGEVGELWLRSATTMAGYWRDPEATAATLVAGGWLRTGDLARLDDRGLVRLAGRAKEMFIRGGYNVYPAEVEAALAAHPAVAEAAVVPRPDPVMGEIGVAVVVPRDPAAPPALDEVRAFLAGRLAAWKLPEALRVVEALPLTPMQKVDRRALARREGERQGTPGPGA
ncbi:MAG TPA: AMP-binding protein [Acidimicrobiales bacterium]|nr:AMP-binding protein [Acidimicrobiales bacterium]